MVAYFIHPHSALPLEGGGFGRGTTALFAASKDVPEMSIR